MDAVDCPWCGEWTRPVQVNGHYECLRCKRVLMDCCDGERAQPDSERFKKSQIQSTPREE